MLVNESVVRVRYGETDKMGVVYYGNYALYYEVGRTDLMRKFGIAYSDLEKIGIQLPVLSMESEYIRSAFYDEELVIKTFVKELPLARIKFYYELYNKENLLVNKGSTTLVFYDVQLKKPIRAPGFFVDNIKVYF